MKHPRRINTYCPHCREHHEHRVEKVRQGQPSGNAHELRKQRRGKKGIGNSGRFSSAPQGEKPTQKTHLRYTCTECGKAHHREGWRAGRLELED